MGPMCFDYGFGPFRWVCASGKPEDLLKTDQIACKVLEDIMQNSYRHPATNGRQHSMD